MAKTSFQTVDDYVASFPAGVQTTLRRLRAILRKVLPGTEEVISYQMAAYKLPGKAPGGGRVIYFAGWKEHYSLYPATRTVIEALKKELAPYEVNDKGTARFPLSEPVPVKLIERFARLRMKEALASAAGVKRDAPERKAKIGTKAAPAKRRRSS